MPTIKDRLKEWEAQNPNASGWESGVAAAGALPFYLAEQMWNEAKQIPGKVSSAWDAASRGDLNQTALETTPLAAEVAGAGWGSNATKAALTSWDPASLGIMIGSKARNFPKQNIPRAEAIAKETIDEAGDYDRSGIWHQTKLHQGSTDPGWRMEIPDYEAVFKPGAKNVKLFGAEQRFGDVFDHPALFENYPQIAEYKTRAVPLIPSIQGTRAAFDDKNKLFYIDPTNKDSLSSTLHEVQHAIQDIEGWPSGASTSMFLKPEREAAKIARNDADAMFGSDKQLAITNLVEEAYRKALANDPVYNERETKWGIQPMSYGAARAMISGWRNGHWKNIHTPLYNEMELLAKEIPIYSQALTAYDAYENASKHLSDREDQAYNLYKRDAGETEARNVQKRYEAATQEEPLPSWVTAETKPDIVYQDLYGVPPWQTEDIPAEQQMNRLLQGLKKMFSR